MVCPPRSPTLGLHIPGSAPRPDGEPDALRPDELILRQDGTFAMGSLQAITLQNEASPQGVRTSVRGTYFLDRHVATLVLESGEVVHALAGWHGSDPDDPSTASSVVFAGRCFEP